MRSMVMAFVVLAMVLVAGRSSAGWHGLAPEGAAATKTASSADKLIGTFKGQHGGEPIRIVIRAAAGGGYEGLIEASDERFTYAATATSGLAGKGMKGKAKEQGGGETFDFTASLKGDDLILDDGSTKITLNRAADDAPAPAGMDNLAGEWTAKVDFDSVTMSLVREGEGYTGTVKAQGRDIPVRLTVKDGRISGRAEPPGEKAEDIQGMIEGERIVFLEKGERIVFSRPGAKDALADLAGRWVGTIDTQRIPMTLTAEGEAFTGEMTVEDTAYIVTLRREGEKLVGTAKSKDGDHTEDLTARVVDGKLIISADGEDVVFTRAGDGLGEITLGTGVKLVLPEGWNATIGERFTTVKPIEGEGDVFVLLHSAKLEGRTHADFAKAFVDLGAVFFLKPTEKELDLAGPMTKVPMQGERKDGTKLVGFAGIETRGDIALGAIIAGKNEDVEKSLEKAEAMMKSVRWPGEPSLKIEIEPQDPGQKVMPDAPAPAGVAPMPVEPGWKRIGRGNELELAAPPDWEMGEDGEVLTLAPPGEEETLVVMIGSDSAEGITDLLGAEARRRLTEAAETVEVDPKLAGEPRTLTVANNPAAIYTFDTKPEMEDEAPARVVFYVLLAGGRVHTLAGHGDKNDVMKHTRTLEKIFMSFKPKGGSAPSGAGGAARSGGGEAPMGGGGAGAAMSGSVDRRLVGTWRHTRHSGTNTTSSTVETTVVLSADGTFTAQSVTMTSTQMGMSNTPGEKLSGRWKTAGGKLTMTYDNGEAETVPYRPLGGAVETGEGDEVMVWEAVK